MLSSANKKPNTATPDVPHELVATHILLHLPVRSLLRFRCVCKAWHDTIDEDSFIRAHLRVQNLSLVVAPLIRNNDDDDRGSSYPKDVTIAGLYRWDPVSQQGGSAATLVHAMTDYDHLFSPRKRYAHDLAHCDGLVLLVPTDAKVLVLNPATRRVLALPSSPHAVRPRRLPPGVRCHQAFGFGHDPRSNTYKVARFFYRYHDGDGYGWRYTLGLGTEVFTLGRDKLWRETAVPPPYPIMGGRTATFFKGSLLWTAEVSFLTNTPAGFIRFKLEDETFSVVTPPPLRGPELNYAASSLAELRGELCLCVPDHPRPTCTSLEMWMCTDLGTSNEPPRWDRRYIIRYAPFAGVGCLRLVAVVDEGTVFEAWSDHLVLCDCRNGEGVLKKGMVSMKKDTRYRNANNEAGVHGRGGTAGGPVLTRQQRQSDLVAL